MKNILRKVPVRVNVKVSVVVPVFVILFVTMLSSCHDDSDDTKGNKKEVLTYKVAVIMPGSQQERWEQTANWALENLERGQGRLTMEHQCIRLELEWYDEDQEDGLVDFVRRVEADPEYKAIIGPLRTDHAFTVATLCEKHHKPLLLPQCTSTEVQRIFSESPNVFNLTQSDIGQAEVMVSLALARHAPSISLLVHCDDVSSAEYQRSYGATFRNWVGFLACEAELPVDTVCTYNDSESLARAVEGLSEYYAAHSHDLEDKEESVLLFVPEKAEELIEYDDYRTYYTGHAGRGSYYPYTLCSNSTVSNALEGVKLGKDYEGVDIAAAATSGFVPAYQSCFGYYATPIGGEAQLFDAIYLLTYALAYDPDDVSGAIAAITDYDLYGYFLSWLPADAGTAAATFLQKSMLPVGGALGKWKFDQRYHASLLNTTYRHWRLTKGRYSTLQYITLAKGKRSVNNEQLWQRNVTVTDTFNIYQMKIPYEKLEGNYAVVVAASTGWQNYRHQADALDVYQMLKHHGYDDDHIMLIMEGDIVNDTNNKHPGEVRVKPGGDNLWQDVVIDYRTSTLQPNDILNILTGNSTERTPNVLPTTYNDNVLMFWSGHGNDGVLYLDRYYMTEDKLSETLWEMCLYRKYRKLFFVVEACYSGSVAKYCEGVPGVLMLTAANPSESSLADIMDPEMNIWLSNGFTRAFREAIEINNNISMRDLYYFVAQQTVGSHATMYNYSLYGNMFQNTMKEYLP